MELRRCYAGQTAVSRRIIGIPEFILMPFFGNAIKIWVKYLFARRASFEVVHFGEELIEIDTICNRRSDSFARASGLCSRFLGRSDSFACASGLWSSRKLVTLYPSGNPSPSSDRIHRPPDGRLVSRPSAVPAARHFRRCRIAGSRDVWNTARIPNRSDL